MINKIVIFGSNGYIGKYLTAHFEKDCLELITISRRNETHSQKNRTHLVWDGISINTCASYLENADFFINLGGKSVNCRYTAKNKMEILNSRILSTTAIGNAITLLQHPPKVWMNMSSATIYRHAQDHYQDEYTGEIKNDFSVQVCKAWEKTLDEFDLPFTRKIKLRTAIVLGKKDGAFPRIIKLVKYYLGGKMGKGTQIFSWIHEGDVARAIEFLYNNKEATGVFNVVSPNAVTNKFLMQTLRQKLGISFGFPTPEWLLKFGAIVIGTETELILKSRWVYPAKLLESGFTYKYDTIANACEELIQ